MNSPPSPGEPPDDRLHDTPSANLGDDYPLARPDLPVEPQPASTEHQEPPATISPGAQERLSRFEPVIMQENEVGDRQFTVAGLLMLTTLAAVLLAPMNVLPRSIYAGLLGGVAVVLLAVQSILKSRMLLLRLGWWVVLGVYLISAGLACAQQVWGSPP